MTSLTPLFVITNLAEEKERFFLDQTYNPQFLYDSTSSHATALAYQPSQELLTLAEEILEECFLQYESVEGVRMSEGALVSQVETERTIAQYLADNQITEEVSVQYSPHFLARTGVNVIGNTCVLKVRQPVAYQEHSIISVLDHEVGTHVFRWLNEFLQPWANHRDYFNLQNHIETEEGLATLHGMLAHPHSYLWQPALYYHLVAVAQQHSFAEVFADACTFTTNKQFAWQLTVLFSGANCDCSSCAKGSCCSGPTEFCCAC